ncbi:hypothetical protein AXG93_2105s1010 [Marchantia polymorpha subsp. ruderalis]|uniref:Cytochrome P450 n=1 Tax=Marchantia polymorpha subsp. ruderalis TaxID=1480154 RepID=A0A176VMB6_MARPO|nr:hypothetical protein AXG93_2105s1010 [Marchantia polymorpha subsp. ruderalis]
MGESNMEGLIAIFKSWFVHTVAAFGFLYVVLKVFRRVRHKYGRRPPGPPSLPVIGQLHHLVSGLLHHTLAKIAEKYGPIMWLELGAVGVVVVSSSDMAREILKAQDHIFASRPSTLFSDLVLGKGQDLAFSPLNDHFRLVRKVYTTQLLSQQQIDTFKDIIIGGTDTSSETIVWAMTELLRHPNIMERLQSELDDVIGKERLVEEADLQKLEYLQAVVKETLRLHPGVVLGVPHFSKEATKVAGYDTPANTREMLNLYAISRDPKVWENPLKFDPSRFLNSPIDVKGQHYEVLPFGSGRRRCPGRTN